MSLAWLALGYALGLFAGAGAGISLAAAGLLALALGAAYLRSRAAGLRVGIAALFLAGGLLGVVRSGPGPVVVQDDIDALLGKTVTARAVVDGVPEAAGRSLRLRADLVERRTPNGWAPAQGAVIIWADAGVTPVEGRSYPYIRHGDTVMLRGTVRPPERIGPFDYPEHLAAQGIGAVVSPAHFLDVSPGPRNAAASVHELRSRLAASLERHMSEPAASLASAMLFGLRSGVPAGVSDAFRDAGLAHLLAISGMHVGIVLAISMLASRALLGRRRGVYLIAPLLLMWAYVLLAGAPPSAVRAGLMASAFLLALASGRMPAAVNALGLAALVLLLIEPRSLWDRSFQLSFTSMAGVLFIGLPARAWTIKRLAGLGERLPKQTAWVVSAALSGLVVSLGAFLGSAPLVAFNFGSVPLLGAPATLLALAVMPLFLVGAGLTAAAGLFLPPLAYATGGAAWPFGAFLTGLAEVVAAAPGGRVDVDGLSAAWVWAAYAPAAVVAAFLGRRVWASAAAHAARAAWHGPANRVEAALAIGVLLILAAAPWAFIATARDGLLHVDVLDVGQGDAILITSPEGGTTLIDGGPDPRAAIEQVDDLLPLGELRIDLAVLTHPHADHMNGLLELARRGRLERVIAPPPTPSSSPSSSPPTGDADAWAAELDSLGLAPVEAVRGMTISLTDGVLIELLNPPGPALTGTSSDVNNNGVAARVVYGEASALFMADLFAEGELALLDAGLDLSADILKLGHHGSRTSTSPELLNAVGPAAAVVSVAAESPFGHPSPEVMERVAEKLGPGRLFSTAENGRVRFSTDGVRWWVSTEHD